MDNIDFGLFYADDEGMLIEANNIELLLLPFEEKYYRFYIGGSSIRTGSLITIDGRIDSLVKHSSITLSLNNANSNYWRATDILTTDDNSFYKVDIKIKNEGYTEINGSVVLDLTLQYLPNEGITNLSYYGDLINGKYLSRPPEPKPSRIIKVNVIPEGADYTSYLAYSHGNALIILDDGSGIPYKEE